MATTPVTPYLSVKRKMRRFPLILMALVGLTVTASTAIATDPKSDLRDLSDTALEEAAQLDAQEYFATHTHIDTANTGEIGTAHAIRHHLLGDQLSTYKVNFFDTLDALIDQKE
jgi:hypothetical protein